MVVCDVLHLVGVPIFRLLLKIAVGVAHKVASINFCDPYGSYKPNKNHQTHSQLNLHKTIITTASQHYSFPNHVSQQ